MFSMLNAFDGILEKICYVVYLQRSIVMLIVDQLVLTEMILYLFIYLFFF